MPILRNWSHTRVDRTYMTAPRQVVANRSYMFTRRCTQRQYLLKPDKITNEAFLYCFTVAAKRHDIEVHWLVVMSNHIHFGARDKTANYPDFLTYLYSLSARCMNVHRKRWENFWSTEQPNALELADSEARFDKMIYGLTNPVKDHSVDRVRLWPGFCSLSYQMRGQSMVVRRPRKFFNPNGHMPTEVTLYFARLPGFEHLSEKQWRKKILKAVTAEEHKAAEVRARTGRKLLGRKAVRRQSAFSYPETTTKRRGLRPRVATRNKTLRIKLLEQHKKFVARYREAFERLKVGDRNVRFPWGTFKLRVLKLVQCEAAPAPS